MGLVITSTWVAFVVRLEASSFAAGYSTLAAPASSTTTFVVAFDSTSACSFVEAVMVLVKQFRLAVGSEVLQSATVSLSYSPSKVSLWAFLMLFFAS